jgi:hypothetical protein
MTVKPKILPTVLIVIDVLCAGGYLYSGGLTEWRKVIYWLAAGTLTYTVTW